MDEHRKDGGCLDADLLLRAAKDGDHMKEGAEHDRATAPVERIV
jgi:hypothetical protein